MKNKTLFAVVASLGFGLLPLGLVVLSGCGDTHNEANPYDAGSDARDSATPTDAPADGPKDGSGEGGGDSGPKDSGPADAPTEGG